MTLPSQRGCRRENTPRQLFRDTLTKHLQETQLQPHFVTYNYREDPS